MAPAAASPEQEAQVDLSLAELLVLGLVAEQPAHGFALARLVESGAQLGRIYRIQRPAVYRTLERLQDAGLVRPQRVEHGRRGPQRTVVEVTPEGRRVAERWLAAPVGHVRDLRTELLVKLALLERSGRDATALLAAQRSALVPIVDALEAQCRGASGFDRTLAVWRFRSAQAALQFVTDVAEPA